MIKPVLAFNIGEELGISNKFPTLGSFFSTILFNVYAVLGILLLFILIIGGWGVIAGAGKGDKGKVAEGGKAITSAIAGFLVIFLSYFIIKIIETVTGASILNP